MTKIKNLISGFILIIFILNVGLPISFAQEVEPTAAEIECVSEKPNYEELKKDWLKIKNKESRQYQRAFLKAQEAYHNYVGCLFDYAETSILQTKGARRTNGIVESNTLNTGSIPVLGGLIDWMAPDQACLKSDKLAEVIKNSDPSQMLFPVLQEHSEYKDHLTFLSNTFAGGGSETNAEGQILTGTQQLEKKSILLREVERLKEMEIDSSLLAIDLMLTSLKELRLAFVMHVHFQCTLKFLEKYGLALEKLRKVIVPLPDQLRDASITN